MNMFRSILGTTVLIILFGWVMSVFYLAYADFADIVKSQQSSWEVTIPLLPIFTFIVIGGIISVFLHYAKKQKFQSWKKALFLPVELEEADEREKYITAQACRASYISLWIACPVITGLLCIYPFISEQMPYYPILLFLLLPLIQVFAYATSWHRQSRI
ncbi:hypothetical protein [Litchfieldia alkalitelluris]|uniref:hypothetical protein n=1 Tax=Litchfieldia alkalitelluris TaxID=304268 RepID=UPI000998686D|nr:hypothetical protein [Litchfieldia alkalitelluris]